jgi:hypothetical protein
VLVPVVVPVPLEVLWPPELVPEPPADVLPAEVDPLDPEISPTKDADGFAQALARKRIPAA